MSLCLSDREQGMCLTGRSTVLWSQVVFSDSGDS